MSYKRNSCIKETSGSGVIVIVIVVVVAADAPAAAAATTAQVVSRWVMLMKLNLQT